MNEQEASGIADIVRLGWPTRATPTSQREGAIQAKVWAAAMTDVAYAEAEAVVIDMMRQGRPHPPAVSEIVGEVFGLRDRLAGTAAPDLDQAVDEIVRRVAKRGYSKGAPRSETWSHPAIADTVRAVGWRELCYGENAGVLRAHIMRLYESARARHVADARRAPQYTALIEAKRSPELPDAVGSKALPASTEGTQP